MLDSRHPATQHLFRFFAYAHLPILAQTISRGCAELAASMIEQIDDGPELTTGLRKLLEAKDCFVRATIPFD